MKSLFRTERFKKDFKSLPQDVQGRLENTLARYLTNPRHPSLQAKKIQGAPGIWELRVSENYRVTFQMVAEGILLRRAGTHDVLRHP